ncbi:hypothetical protein HDV00_008102, partial [Rhizophlyctis rosea]
VMRVAKLKLGVYFHANVGSNFCLYTFPDPSKDSTATSASTDFYCLKDVEILFFHKDPGYLLTAQVLEQRFLRSSRHCFRENTGAVYLSTTALADVASKLGNRVLGELCGLSRDSINDGRADTVLNEIKGLSWKHPFAVTEEELEPEAEGKPIPDAPVSILDKPRLSNGGSSAGSVADDESGIDTAMSEADEKGKGSQSGTTPSKSKVPENKSHKRARSDADQMPTTPGDSSSIANDDEPQSRPKQRKRLSINTALAHNLPFRAPDVSLQSSLLLLIGLFDPFFVTAGSECSVSSLLVA